MTRLEDPRYASAAAHSDASRRAGAARCIGQRIDAALTGYELQVIAADAAATDLTPTDRSRLQWHYAARVRQLWPEVFRRARA